VTLKFLILKQIKLDESSEKFQAIQEMRMNKPKQLEEIINRERLQRDKEDFEKLNLFELKMKNIPKNADYLQSLCKAVEEKGQNLETAFKKPEITIKNNF